MQHGLVVEQHVAKYEINVLESIEKQIKEGWRVVTMTGTPRGNVFVVFERYVTACGERVTCLGCLAEG
jgi:hypothetical protein